MLYSLHITSREVNKCYIHLALRRAYQRPLLETSSTQLTISYPHIVFCGMVFVAHLLSFLWCVLFVFVLCLVLNVVNVSVLSMSCTQCCQCLCIVYVLYSMLPVSLYCIFPITRLVFYNDYELLSIIWNWNYCRDTSNQIFRATVRVIVTAIFNINSP